MALFSFGKRPKPRAFGFVPRYWDKDKEEFEARMAKYSKDSDNVELMKSRIKSGFKQKAGGDRATYKAASRQSNIRLFVIIFALVLAVVFILQSDGVLNMIQAFAR